MPHIITDITILKYTIQKKKYSLEEVVYIGIVRTQFDIYVFIVPALLNYIVDR
jgi:hypothetical protein